MRGTDVCPLCLVTLVARALLRCVFRDGCVLRNIFQMKEQDKTPEQLSEVERGNSPKKEYRVIIVKMIQEFMNRMDAQSKKIQEVFNKEVENINNN